MRTIRLLRLPIPDCRQHHRHQVAGKEKAFNALVGQAMKATKGKANPQQVNELLRKKLAG
jgi:Asp-tRNA(Asn)/Glu-tRNA(Gln) amidotransferase B subunit